MAKALMIQGTGSGVGKSLVVAGLCRILRDRGIDVAPFKAQNMALNSFITRDGGEIGRAQAFQAEAARVEPATDMNPILLKATGEAGCQVIVDGRVRRNMRAGEYYDAFRDEAWTAVAAAYGRLAERHEVIVLEGAGSPAEINLNDVEVVNMRMARHAGAPVLLVGDIDKGGVFASFYGTIGLLDGDASLIRAFVINKFRGDRAILEPGLRMIAERTGRSVVGVIPHLGDLGVHEEDGIPLERLWWSERTNKHGSNRIRIAVVRLRSISNFTDFDPFLYEPDVELVYTLRDEDIGHADLVILPGSKNTVQDLLFLRESGIEAAVLDAASKGVAVAGICGGYQMLGRSIADPLGVESTHREVRGMGLLDVETVLEGTKITSQVEARAARDSAFGVHGGKKRDTLRAYEIHMGRTTGDVGLFSVVRYHSPAGTGTADPDPVPDGSAKGSVWGTYLHGIFDNDGFRRALLNRLREQRGYGPPEGTVSYARAREQALDRWAAVLKKELDLEFIDNLIAL